MTTIVRELGLAKETVRRFYRITSVDELLAKPRTGRPSVLDEFKPYLHERGNAGVYNASVLRERSTFEFEDDSVERLVTGADCERGNR